MNRILLDKIENRVINKDKNEIIININKNENILVKESFNYVFNIDNCVVNFLFEIEDKSDINLTFNIINSNVTINSFFYNKSNVVINSYLNESSILRVYNSLISNKTCNVKVSTYHNSSNTKSYIYNCGLTYKLGSILLDVTSKVYKESIKCDVNQDNKIICLNDKNNNKINPNLLIDCYDVSAKHGAYIGKFKEKDLFYLMSRGINKDDAYNLLINGYLIGIMQISDEEKEVLKNKISIKGR